ncbi:MAG: metalloregulator ArsR/SmtB family transcription factor [Pseudomonadota bacterium]
MLNPMVEDPDQLNATFAALSDPTRRAMLARLLEGDATVNALCAPFDMSLAAAAKHLQILARTGLVIQEKRGREKWCRLAPDRLAPAVIWMQSFGHVALEDYDALEHRLEDLGLLSD